MLKTSICVCLSVLICVLSQQLKNNVGLSRYLEPEYIVEYKASLDEFQQWALSNQGHVDFFLFIAEKIILQYRLRIT